MEAAIEDETRAALGKIDWKKEGLTLKKVAVAVTPVWKSSDAAPAAAAAEGIP